ncbi:MAG: hypothetical protein HF314_18655 [Ignavibacteria bacterium]|jgi:hypothetical protein|nr:hypothetical protein [Ignavibacteria bacterium]MCU7505110.1 hypothetical protein [Ignavibacteria bacterium]MCU7518058.1 hypothetical protein [Ignavibacteria bacterium]
MILMLSFVHLPLQAQVTRLGGTVDSISRFIASDYFLGLQSHRGSLELTDTLFHHALRLYDGNVSKALLSLTFATVPYKKVPVILPLIKLKVDIPFYAPGDSIFHLKNSHLPRDLFYNSPIDEGGDRDKLAHFFGSAYLAYSSGIFDFTKIIGIFVEEFEEKFYIQSSADPRDIAADELGEMFGKALKKNEDVLPSEVLLTYPLIFFRYNL